MKRVTILPVILTVVGITACVFITSTGSFYVANESSGPIYVSWTDQSDAADSLIIAAGETKLIASHQILEADDVPPEQVFQTFTIYSDSALTNMLYEQNPIDNGEWEREADGFRAYKYTLVFPRPQN